MQLELRRGAIGSRRVNAYLIEQTPQAQQMEKTNLAWIARSNSMHALVLATAMIASILISAIALDRKLDICRC
jgi:hypothetical protein